MYLKKNINRKFKNSIYLKYYFSNVKVFDI